MSTESTPPMTPEQCFIQMAKTMDYENPSDIGYERLLDDFKQLAGVTHTFANIIDSVFNHSPAKGKNVGVVIDSPQGKCVVMKEEDFKIMYNNNKKTEELKEQYNVVVGTSNKYADEVEELKEKLIEKSTSYLTKCEIDLLKTKKVYALEEENKKLKAEWGILNNFCPEEAENNGQAVVDWICKFFKIEDDFGNLEEENKKLNEQNEDNLASLNFYTEQCAELKDERKKLKETIQHCEGVMESDEDLEERLKAQHQIDMEEYEEYKLIIDGLGTMVENIDQNACDVFNKLTQEYRNQFDEVHHK